MCKENYFFICFLLKPTLTHSPLKHIIPLHYFCSRLHSSFLAVVVHFKGSRSEERMLQKQLLLLLLLLERSTVYVPLRDIQQQQRCLTRGENRNLPKVGWEKAVRVCVWATSTCSVSPTTKTESIHIIHTVLLESCSVQLYPLFQSHANCYDLNTF